MLTGCRVYFQPRPARGATAYSVACDVSASQTAPMRQPRTAHSDVRPHPHPHPLLPIAGSSAVSMTRDALLNLWRATR